MTHSRHKIFGRVAPAIFSTAILLFSFLALNAAQAATSEVEARYGEAAVVREFVSILRAKTISNDLKTVLLDKTRPADKSFAQKIAVGWKGYNDKNVHAEFDQLVVRGDDGKEVLRLKSLPSPANTYLINDRVWVVPAQGSIEKSLRQHLNQTPSTSRAGDSRASSAAIFFGATYAVAANGSVDAVIPAFLFATARNTNETAQNALLGNSARRFLGRPENGFGSFWRDALARPVDVRCEKNSAFGLIEIEGEKRPFQSKADGSLVITLRDKTKILITAPVIDGSVLSDTMTIASCLKDDCSKVDPVAKSASGSSSGPWSKRGAFKAANEAESERVQTEREAALSLRPLGQCCENSECRETLLRQHNINFVPTTSGATKK